MNPVRIICRVALGLVWLYEGLVPKLLFVRQDQIDLVERSGLYFGTPEFFLQLLGAGQVLCGLWLLAGRRTPRRFYGHHRDGYPDRARGARESGHAHRSLRRADQRPLPHRLRFRGVDFLTRALE
jgi:hypothetical protein